MDRAALAEFLTTKRERLKPEDVGLPPGARRRVAGLRREEVAALAVMSTDYYTRLEQRRGPQPSVQMLGALARALRLTPDERDYLFRVAGHSAPDRVGTRDYIAPGLLRVFDRLSDTPAVIMSTTAETLVQNEPARALFGDVDGYRGFERSAIYRWFVHPDRERGLYPEYDRGRQGRALVASLRAAYGLEGPGSGVAELVAALSAASPEFTELWDSQVVATRFEDHKVLMHRLLGDIEVDCQVLFTEDQSQVLMVLTAPPRSEAAQKLEMLSVIGTQELG